MRHFVEGRQNSVGLNVLHVSQRARKFKKVMAKKLVKSNKSIFFVKLHFVAVFPGQKFIFWPFLKLLKNEISSKKLFFAVSKMAKNHFLSWEKFKTVRNAISRKKLIYLISRVFLQGLF